jgi:uncharacterized protein (DUF305 family)
MTAAAVQPNALTALRSPWRWLVAPAAAVGAAVHIPVIAPHLDEAPYMGALFIALTIACFAIALLLLAVDAPLLYGFAALTCGLAIVGYIATRVVAFPELADDVGNWAEPLGVVAIVSEAVVVGGSIAALRRQAAGVTRGRTALVAVTAVGALVVAGGAGYLWGTSGSGTSVAADSVDAGFARDMSTHHRQAITMAGYTRDHTSDPDIRLLARDIETEQYFQIGELQGWLDTWGLTRDSSQPVMGWMSGDSGMDGMDMGSGHAGHGGPAASASAYTADTMPGMASPDEMAKLQTLTGPALDVDFLQLMLRHHQGGLPMAQYAAAHASQPYVRDLAQKMVQAQTGEITAMQQLLAARGASPLPAPPTK